MSLLGRLLSAASSSSIISTASPSRNPLDSNLEDQFTHNLLFPDAEALCHNDQVFPLSSGTVLPPATSSNFDVNTDIDLDARDVRVIIMQEATPLSGSAYLLYDSHTPPAPSPAADKQAAASTGPAYQSRSEGRRSISSPRKPSIGQTSRPLVIQQDAPAAPRTFGAFDRRSQHSKQLSYTETEAQRSAREYREEVTTLSNCIFGNSDVLAHKGTGTKVHILPSESRTVFAPSSYVGDGNGSLGRSSMRSSKLAQSFTSDTVHGPTSGGFSTGSSGSSARAIEKRKVLITRMFPVPLPNVEVDDAAHGSTPTQDVQSPEMACYPFPKVGEEDSLQTEKKKIKPKQKRTPMYAVGLIIHLPIPPIAPPPVSRSSFRGPSSYTEQESYTSSFNSARRSGWTMLGNGFGVDSLDSSLSSDIDDRIEIVTQHWDIIMRTLSHLQAVATASLLPLLKQADISSPDPRRESVHNRTGSSSVSISGKRVAEDIKPFKAPKTNAKMVQLSSNCLMQVQIIVKEVNSSRQRIVSGMKTRQVVTGQGRWGIWREEARLVGKWAGSKDEGFFFFNFLTAFLGNHTEWLQALGPTWYRRRRYQQQRASKDEDISLPARTIIVSDNKLMARRLVFLLSAFLPASTTVTSGRIHRPSTSTSFGAYSQSPPNYAVPILREESLRRRINKRAGAAKSVHSRTMSFPNQTSQGPTHLGPEIHHGRRTSDAASLKTANLPIPGSTINTRKSSAATTSTVTPVTTMPHFSTRRPIRGTGPLPRPGSSGSLATDDLLRSLHRGESSGQYSSNSTDVQSQNSRWGSMISGFWGGSKRRESTSSTSIEPLSVDGLEVQDSQLHEEPLNSSNKLIQMVEEASLLHKTKEQQERETRKSDGSTNTAKPENTQVEDVSEQVVQVSERVLHPSGAYESPVKTSINEIDGVIDIDVPLPDYLTFESAISSPSSSGYLSTPGFGNGMEGFEHFSRSGPDLDTKINVGGWLQHYNPDFALQAVMPQENLLEEVKASMRAEPTPPFISTPQPDMGRARWVDISSAIIADTTQFAIKHIRYQRLVKPRDMDQPLSDAHYSLDSRYGNVYSGANLTPAVDVFDNETEDRFMEEAIISMDETLIEAVERIIARSGQGSKTSSVCSSRSTSRKGKSRDRSNSDTKAPGSDDHRLEVPRNECKRMVLTALEDIVREVADSRKERGDVGGQLERESFLREGVRNWLINVETLD